MIFQFIAEPVSTVDMLYNLILFDTLFAVGYIGFRSIVRVFYRIRKNGKRGMSDKC